MALPKVRIQGGRKVKKIRPTMEWWRISTNGTGGRDSQKPFRFTLGCQQGYHIKTELGDTCMCGKSLI